jgi:hypothetical protein
VAPFLNDLSVPWIMPRGSHSFKVQLKIVYPHIQGRINAIDNKASVLIAIQAGLFGVSTFVVEKLFLTCDELKVVSYVALTIIGILTAFVVGFLLQAIRPTKHFFSLESGMPKIESSEIIWPNMRQVPTVEDFVRRLTLLQDDDIEKDLRAAVFAGHFMVFKKYRYYRSALRLAKFQLIVTFTLLLLIPIWRFI